MAKPKIITGLDIGTYSIKALAVAQSPDSQSLEVLGFAEAPSAGVRRGIVFDINKVSASITEAVSQLQENIGHKVENIYVNIGGSHIFSTSSKGTVIVSRADKRISEEDVNRVIQAAKAISLPSNNEILEVFPKEFIIDGQGQIKEPREMQGLKLETDVVALCAFSPYKNNLTSAVLNADFQVLDIIPSSLASSRAVLTPQQKELGVCLLDIGAGTTDLVIYQEGDLKHVAVFPIGSSHITSDLAVGLKTDIELAEQIKKEFGACVSKAGNKKEKIETEDGEFLTFSRRALVKIIEARVSDIFDLAREEIKKVSPEGFLPAGIVLTGGGAKLSKIIELAKKELKLPARIGLPQNQEWEGIDKDPAFSTVCGLVLAGYEVGGPGPIHRVPSPGIWERIKKVLEIFIP